MFAGTFRAIRKPSVRANETGQLVTERGAAEPVRLGMWGKCRP